MSPPGAQLRLWGSGRWCSCGPRLGRSRQGGGLARRPRADLPGQVLGVVLDEAEQGRAPGVLPGQADEVQAGRFGDAALVHDRALGIEYRHVDPGVIEPEPGGPDYALNVELAVLAESHRCVLGVESPLVEVDSAAAQ